MEEVARYVGIGWDGGMMVRGWPGGGEFRAVGWWWEEGGWRLERGNGVHHRISGCVLVLSFKWMEVGRSVDELG